MGRFRICAFEYKIERSPPKRARAYGVTMLESRMKTLFVALCTGSE
jgi:hypothetical protein